MKALIAVLEDEDQISTYTVKLTKQLAELDTLLEKLRAAVKNTDLEDAIEIPSGINKNNKRVFSYMQMRVQATEKIIYTKIQIVRDTEKEPGANTVLSKVLAHLRLLDDVRHILDKDVDIVSNQIINC